MAHKFLEPGYQPKRLQYTKILVPGYKRAISRVGYTTDADGNERATSWTKIGMIQRVRTGEWTFTSMDGETGTATSEDAAAMSLVRIYDGQVAR